MVVVVAAVQAEAAAAAVEEAKLPAEEAEAFYARLMQPLPVEEADRTKRAAARTAHLASSAVAVLLQAPRGGVTQAVASRAAKALIRRHIRSSKKRGPSAGAAVTTTTCEFRLNGRLTRAQVWLPRVDDAICCCCLLWLFYMATTNTLIINNTTTPTGQMRLAQEPDPGHYRAQQGDAEGGIGPRGLRGAAARGGARPRRPRRAPRADVAAPLLSRRRASQGVLQPSAADAPRAPHV